MEKLLLTSYTWFEKPRINQKNQRGEDGVGFFVWEYLVNKVKYISNTRYEESV